MLVILIGLIALASAQAAVDAPKPDAPPLKSAKAQASAKSPNENCVVVKKRMILGHEVTHVKCEDPKPAPKPAA